MTEVSVGYQTSPLNGPVAYGIAGPLPGERVAAMCGLPPLETGSLPRFTLFSETSEAALELLRTYPTLIDPDLRPPFATEGMWLVRPDGYAACSARAKDWQVIADYLDALAD